MANNRITNCTCRLGLGLSVLVWYMTGTVATECQSRPRLTYSQVEQLVEIGTPDAAIASEIQARGLSRAPGLADLGRLETRRAGPLTIAALRAVANGALLLGGLPAGAEVLVDGAPAGHADAAGALFLDNVPPGSRTVTVQKAGFSSTSRRIDVTHGRVVQASIQLATAEGTLSILTNVTRARVRVDGSEVMTLNGREIRLAAGPHIVEVTADGWAAVRRTIGIRAGEHTAVQITLGPDSAEVDRLRVLLRRQAEDPTSAATAARALLGYFPKDPEANAAVAVHAFTRGDPETFHAAASEAISGGAAIQLKLIHHHGSQIPEHEVILVLRRGSLFYNPLGARCTWSMGQIAARSIVETRTLRLEQAAPAAGGARTLRSATGDYFELRVKQEGKGSVGSLKFTSSNAPEARVFPQLLSLIASFDDQPQR